MIITNEDPKLKYAVMVELSCGTTKFVSLFKKQIDTEKHVGENSVVLSVTWFNNWEAAAKFRARCEEEGMIIDRTKFDPFFNYKGRTSLTSGNPPVPSPLQS